MRGFMPEDSQMFEARMRLSLALRAALLVDVAYAAKRNVR